MADVLHELGGRTDGNLLGCRWQAQLELSLSSRAAHTNGDCQWCVCGERAGSIGSINLAATLLALFFCGSGIQCKDKEGEGFAMKPTTFLTNSLEMQKTLSRKCVKGQHRHVHLMEGRASAAQVYPKGLCRAIADGIPIGCDSAAAGDTTAPSGKKPKLPASG